MLNVVWADILRSETQNNIKISMIFLFISKGKYGVLTGRGAEIIYEFENFEVLVPSSATAEATHAKWKMNGVLKIRTRDHAKD